MVVVEGAAQIFWVSCYYHPRKVAGCTRTYQDARTIDARHGVLVEVVVQVYAVGKRRHNVEQSKDSRLAAPAEETSVERSTSSGGGRKPHGCTTKDYYSRTAVGR